MSEVHGRRQVRGAKILLIAASVACFIFLGLAAYQGNFGGAWRAHQRAYREQLPAELKTSFRIGFKQAYLPDLDRVDRCITCHVAVEDPKRRDAPQPLAMHSGSFLKHHSPDKFGCTICHDGQGRAVSKVAAHGLGPDWDKPLLTGEEVYTSCSRCHSENDLFGAEADFYGRPFETMRIHLGELTAALRGSPCIIRGKALVAKGGCLGCHTYRGKGGSLGPNITYVGDKPSYAFDYSHLDKDDPHTPRQWLLRHFANPSAVSPGTAMPNFRLNPEEIKALTQYMLSLKRRTLPARFLPPPPRQASPFLDGQGLFNLFCAACHGKGGKRGLPNPNSPMGSVPALNYLAERLNLFEQKDAALVASMLKTGKSLKALKKKPPFDNFSEFLDELNRIRKVIRGGVHTPKKDPHAPGPPLRMPSFGKSFSPEEIDALIAYIIEQYPWGEDDD